jgi:hypothetical protein
VSDETVERLLVLAGGLRELSLVKMIMIIE